MVTLRRLFFAGCVDDDGVVSFVLLRVLLGVVVVEVTARLTGVRRRFGEVVVVDFALAVRFGDFLPVENGAVEPADDDGVAAVVLVFVADPNCCCCCCCCCRRLSLHNLARARASAAASFLDFLAGVAPPLLSPTPPSVSSAFRFLGGILWRLCYSPLCFAPKAR